MGMVFISSSSASLSKYLPCSSSSMSWSVGSRSAVSSAFCVERIPVMYAPMRLMLASK